MGCCGGSYLTGGETRRVMLLLLYIIGTSTIMSRSSHDSLFLFAALRESLGDNSDIVKEKH